MNTRASLKMMVSGITLAGFMAAGTANAADPAPKAEAKISAAKPAAAATAATKADDGYDPCADLQDIKPADPKVAAAARKGSSADKPGKGKKAATVYVLKSSASPDLAFRGHTPRTPGAPTDFDR